VGLLLQDAVSVIDTFTDGDVLLAETVHVGGAIQVTVTDAVLPVPPAFVAETEYVRAPAVALVATQVEVVELQPVQL
jgi:hypothetical protein